MYTGQLARTHQIMGNGGRNSISDATLHTYAAELQQAGYVTAHIGKWHMDPTDDPRAGFDHWVSFKGQGSHIDVTLDINGAQIKKDGYTTDLLTDEAIKFIQQDHGGRPYSMMLSYKALHGPFPDDFSNVPPHLRALYDDEPIPLPPSAQVGYTLEGKTMLLNSQAVPGQTGFSRNTTLNQIRMAAHVDENFGRLLEALEQRGQLNDTLIVFTSDNGYFWGEHGLNDKRAAYEESIRIPLLIRFPKLIIGGTFTEALVTGIDLAPTLLEIAGVDVPESMQGKSLLSVLENPYGRVRDAFFAEYFREEITPINAWPIATWKAVRDSCYKYITYPDYGQSWDELYDLYTDPYEMNNIVNRPEAQQTLEEMRTKMAQLEQELLPRSNRSRVAILIMSLMMILLD
jgi:N-acetylglucosamine-6-sulfatase